MAGNLSRITNIIIIISIIIIIIISVAISAQTILVQVPTNCP